MKEGVDNSTTVGDFNLYFNDIFIKQEQLHVNCLNNFNEKGKFLERHKVPKLTQEQLTRMKETHNKKKD